MASPPGHSFSPSALSPPYPSSAQLPKKRPSDIPNPQANKRRKASNWSNASGPPPSAHPLRQASFPSVPASPFVRSPSVDTASQVSGSLISTATGAAAATGKKKRGRKPKKDVGSKEQTPSLVGGKAPTNVSGTAGGEKENDAGGHLDDLEQVTVNVAEMEGAGKTSEQVQEEIRLRAMLVESFDKVQYSRYELWRAIKLSDAVVRRVVNATVSQSVPASAVLAVRTVGKMFAGNIVEMARQVQAEWIAAGDEEAEIPKPPTREGDEEPELRGPLRPDHLREAWRRYKLAEEGGGVGLQGLWHLQQGTGAERFSKRNGKIIFR